MLSIIRSFSTSAAEARGFFNALQFICIRTATLLWYQGLPRRSERFLKDVDKPFLPGNKSFGGGKGKESFPK